MNESKIIIIHRLDRCVNDFSPRESERETESDEQKQQLKKVQWRETETLLTYRNIPSKVINGNVARVTINLLQWAHSIHYEEKNALNKAGFAIIDFCMEHSCCMCVMRRVNLLK